MYQALYRKWRPRTFDDVVGQAHITETLKNQIAADRLSHAYLFIGTRGTGKTTCAKILARAVNCLHPVDGNPCNECSACLGIEDGSIMDVVELDAASNNGVDNVRALRDEAVFTPASVKKRVYIVDEVHMLSTSAFNALLKILEEPPEHLMFILATTELQKVPATILSRCQRHSFKRLDADTVAGRLNYVARQEHIELSPEAAQLLGRLADGSMRDGLSLLDQCSGRGAISAELVLSAMGLAGNLQTVQLLCRLAAHDTDGALELFQQLWRDGKDPGTLLGELCTLQRDALMTLVAPKSGGDLLSGGYDAASLQSVTKAFSAGELLYNLDLLQTTLADMRSVQNPRTAAELCLVRLSDPSLCDSAAALSARVSRLERDIKNRPSPTIPEAQAVPTVSAEPAAQAVPAPEPEPTPEPVSEPVPKPEPEPEFIPVPAPPSEQPEPIREAQLDTVVSREPVFEPDSGTPEPVAPAEPGSWEAVLAALKGRLPIGTYNIISEPYHAQGGFAGDELRVAVKNGFAMGMLNRTDIIAGLRAAATAVLGHPATVKLELSDEPQGLNDDKLNALSRFGGIVKFE